MFILIEYYLIYQISFISALFVSYMRHFQQQNKQNKILWNSILNRISQNFSIIIYYRILICISSTNQIIRQYDDDMRWRRMRYTQRAQRSRYGYNIATVRHGACTANTQLRYHALAIGCKPEYCPFIGCRVVGTQNLEFSNRLSRKFLMSGFGFRRYIFCKSY